MVEPDSPARRASPAESPRARRPTIAAGAAHLTRGFLFADLRDYTGYVEGHGNRAAAALLERFRDLVRGAIADADGAEIKTEGDSFYVVFDAVSDAVRCGLAIVGAAAAGAESEDPIRVGVGVHAGETVAMADGYVGSAVNIAARLGASAGAGEVVVSDTVRALTRTALEAEFVPLGSRRLKGVPEPVTCYRVVPRDAGATVPVARAEPQRPRPILLATFAVGTLTILVAAGIVAVGASRPGPSPTPAASAAGLASTPTVTAPSPVPSPSDGPTAPTDAFPNAAEQALLADLEGLPDGFARTCRRGPYAAVIASRGTSQYEGTATPIASLECLPGIQTGASDVIVMRFDHGLTNQDFVGRTIEWVVLVAVCEVNREICGGQGQTLWLEHAPSNIPIPPGDCRGSRSANGPWQLAGEQRGSIVCRVDRATGDALLDWSHDADGILVRARNARGDSAGLYRFFEDYARFIDP